MSEEASIRDYFNYTLIRDRISLDVRGRVLKKLEVENKQQSKTKNETYDGIRDITNIESDYHLDESLMLKVNVQNLSVTMIFAFQAMIHMDRILKGLEGDTSLKETLHQFVKNRVELKPSENTTVREDLEKIRRSAVASFSFCSQMVNDMQRALKELSCQTKLSNVNPLLIIFFAMLTLGVGRTMPWALGIPLIGRNS